MIEFKPAIVKVYFHKAVLKKEGELLPKSTEKNYSEIDVQS